MHLSGSKTWHDHANAVLFPSVIVKCVNVAPYMADVILTWHGALMADVTVT